MTTYTALANRIRAAETRQELAKREEQIARHFNAGTITAPQYAELSRLDGKINGKDIFYSRHLADNPHNHRAMILPDEDRHRFDAPPEPSSDQRWDEPEDYADYIDTFTDEPE
jgi:hypothetical protein